MRTHKIEEKVIRTIFVSDDGKFESRCSGDVIEYEKKKCLENSKAQLLYQTITQYSESYGTVFLNYYIYECPSKEALKAAVIDATTKEDMHIADYAIKNASSEYTEGIKKYVIRIIDWKDSSVEVKISTLDKLSAILEEDKKYLLDKLDRLNKDIDKVKELMDKDSGKYEKQ